MESTWLTYTIKALVYSIGLLAFLLTVLPLFNKSYWVYRIGDFPRLQIAAIFLFVLLALPFVSGFDLFTVSLMVVAAVCLVYQLFRIIPYTPLYSKQVERSHNADSDRTIRILASNVQIENRNADELLSRIDNHNPDVILLAEVDEWWDEKMSGLKEDYPNNICHPLDNAYGMNFYTRLETRDCQLNFIVEDDIPSVETKLILPSGEEIKFYGLHPRPPVPNENTRSAERDAELLIVGKKIEEDDIPTVIAGDFNDVAWSETTNLFQKISGLLDARIGRGFFNSFHAKIFFLRMPLDHVFQSKHFRLVSLQRLESIGSDHFPIYIELSLENTAEKTQKELEKNGDEEEQAEEKIKEAMD